MRYGGSEGTYGGGGYFVVSLTIGAGSASNPSVKFAGDTFGWFMSAANSWAFGGGGGSSLLIATNVLRVNNTMAYAWSSTTAATGSADTGVARAAASVVEANNGTPGTLGSFKANFYSTGAPVTETNSTHTVAATTAYLICNRAGTITVTLPAAASFVGRQLVIRTIQAQQVDSNASNVVPRIGGAAGTAILGASDGAWALLVSDGTNWEIMAGS